ncbi:DNA phosphorothioation-associated protein 4 [Brucella anthropi]|uniref:DNA phosphorothioation-associated protein 4 n=1 Tax=Brucella TaxID=234 RepID=UPI001ED9EFF1|nr:DNA phosphorothioation-associated protein 4 [Brucella pseudogrignonensis]UKK94118.1 DNA phosphorothioation-associated protein 4 [Brucella pseudogrignonensis]
MSRAANINRSRIHEDMVQRLAMIKLPGTDRTLFPTIRELLCFAALLGYSEGRRIPLDRSEGTEDVSYQQFERRDAEDLIFLIALADSKDPEILKDGEESRCAEIFEEYANGGLQVIRDAMLRSGGEYPDRDILELLKRSGYLNIEEAEPDIEGISF